MEIGELEPEHKYLHGYEHGHGHGFGDKDIDMGDKNTHNLYQDENF
jgi:hypothetical protein